MKLDLSHLSKQNYTPHPATPIQPMPQLTKAVCGDNSTENTMLYIKRDDLLMGLCGGGNKVRKLEYAMAAALEAGADTIVTCGAVQSNHCRLTLAACIREGLQCSLVVEERVPGSYHPEASGNHYLFQLLGAEHIRRVGLGEAQDEIQVLKKELEAQGRKVYVIPGGASNALGTTGYVSCANEIMHQMETDDSVPNHFDYIVCCSGSGGTHAGMSLAFAGEPSKVIGISTRHDKHHQEQHIHALAEQTLQFLTNDATQTLSKDAVQVYDDYVGDGYSLPTLEMEHAVTLFARTEGILLDPVYTGKAAAGLIDLVQSGKLKGNILFLHTGGAPSLFHYQPLIREAVSTTTTTTTTAVMKRSARKDSMPSICDTEHDGSSSESSSSGSSYDQVEEKKVES